MQSFLYFFLSVSLLPFSTAHSQTDRQTSTGESQLEAGDPQTPSTVIGGYGNALYQHDFNNEAAHLNFERFVLFVGHRFNERISLFSEVEIEDAKVEGGEPGGEIALEQAYVKFDLDRSAYLVAGLFIPRIGIINEDHLPNRFNGNERPLVETYVIPSTWRELGLGLYGTLRGWPLRYSIALMNGLNSAAFEHGSGIRNGRYEGRDASANSLGVTGALQYQAGNLQLQLSGYTGGTVPLSSTEADSLHLTPGPFGTPVILGEAHARYEQGGLQAKLLGTIVSIPDAGSINTAFTNNTPRTMWGAYAEAGYDLLSSMRVAPRDPQLILFLRFERFDLNAKVPANGVKDETLNQAHLISGFTYLPHPSVVIKADVRFAHTGEENPLLTGGSQSGNSPYESGNTFVNLGIGFSF
jgi:hypothetical protein